MLKYRKIYYAFSGTLVIGSILSLLVFGLQFGTDFKGGSIMEVAFGEARPSHEAVRAALLDFQLGEIILQDSGQSNLVLKFREVNETVHQGIRNKLETLGKLEEARFESTGPAIGEETKNKALWAMGLVVIMIMVYVAWAFRRVNFPVRSWKYGVIAVIALFHDILITIGAFSLLGYFLRVEVDVSFIAALLTILGYSVNDTIVVFDRIRENVLRQGSAFDFGEVINRSVSQTFMRSFNTSFTTLMALIAIFFFGGETVKYFAFALIVGITVGTYSSIFLASPLLFSWSMLKSGKR